MTLRLCYKIWLEKNGKAFGTGPFKLLANIEKYGSLNEAAVQMEMSYSKAWKLINMAEQRLGRRLLHRETGGRMGGGSYLTGEAKSLMTKYEGFMLEAQDLLHKLYVKHFGTYFEMDEEEETERAGWIEDDGRNENDGKYD